MSNENTDGSTNKTENLSTNHVSESQEIRMLDKEADNSECMQRVTTIQQAVSNQQTQFVSTTDVPTTRYSVRLREKRTHKQTEEKYCNQNETSNNNSDNSSSNNHTNSTNNYNYSVSLNMDQLQSIRNKMQHCSNCKSTLVEICQIKGNGDILYFCKSCDKQYKFETQVKLILGERERKIAADNYVIAVVSKMSGLTYNQYKENRSVCNAYAYCKSVYNDLGSYDLYEATQMLWDKLLYSVVAPIIRKVYFELRLIHNQDDILPLVVKFDTCYTQRGHHSLDGHSVMKDAITGLIIGFKCHHRDSPSGHRTGNLDVFFDEASGMNV